MLIAIILFIAVYAGLVIFRHHRAHVTWAGIALAILLGAIEFREIVPSINWNVLGIFAGTLVLAELFIISKVPEAIADILINRSPNLGMAFLAIVAFTSALSMFVENVAAVLIVAPIAIQLARKAGVSPVPVIIGIAITSNLQGTATLIGDPPSMILGAAMKMNFMEFIVYPMRDGSGVLKPGIFWFVQIGAVVSLAVLLFFFKGMKRKLDPIPVTPVFSIVPSFLMILMILLLACATFIDPGFTWFGGTVCMAMAFIGCVWYSFHDHRRVLRIAREFDWGTAAFLTGVFVLVGMLDNRGVIEAVVGRLGALRGAHPFLLYSTVVWVSVLLSGFIDNVPYVTAMLPVVIRFATEAALPVELFAFGLLIGACLGGNITPIGASANVVAVGLLHREGHSISFGRFMKMGFPFTIAATVASYIALWFFYR
ncbi:MAG: SLC13 family permease [Candidatus Krumholzibacteria bacterium]|nr:SLC13 family permease [Candidatus Krumholzibacteria bacterium]